MMPIKCIPMNEVKYTAIFEPAVEGGYTVTVPALPGCISEGNSFKDATMNIREAIELYLEEYMTTHDTPPVEKEQPILSSIDVKVATV